MAQNVFFKKGLLANLPASYSAGTFYVTTDERAMYLDIDDSTRIRLGDFIQVAAVDNLPTEGASTSALYYCVAENILAKWNGSEWTQINKQPTADEMKVLLGLGDMAYKSEVAEGDLNADLAAKINAASGAQHTHDNKAVIDGITATKVAAWDAAEQNAKDYADDLDEAMNARVEALEAIDHEHANKDLLDTYTQTEANLADAVAKKHSHANADELAKIVDGDKAKWDAVAADHLTSADKTTLENAIKEAKKAGTDANTALETYKVSNDARVKAVEDDIAEITATEGGILAQAKAYSDGKLATARTEITAEIDADVKVVADDLAGYKTANDAALAGVKATAEAAATKEYTDTELAKKVNKTDYEADKATFAIAETVNAALDLKANAADVVANDTFEEFKTANTQAIADAKAGAVADVEAKGYAVATEVAATYATQIALAGVDAKFANYVTAASYATDKAAIEKAIEDEGKARSEADAGFEARIADLEANFGDGEGTVEAQIAAAVAAEAEIARAAEKANADAIDALEGRMDTAEGKIADLEAASATHATKDELNGVDAKFAQYITSASYAEDKAGIDEAIADRYTKDEADAKFALIADAYDDEEVRGLISANADAIAAEKERAELAEVGLQTQINTIMNNPDAEGAINSINEFTQYIKDHGTIADGFRADIDKNKEDIAANAKAIADHEALAAETYETKTDASAKLAEAKSYADGIVATEKAAREAADAELSAAIEAAKVDASNKDTVVLSEAQKYVDAAKADAIADAASKYEAKGTAQGIVDGLKLSETYEPIGAENRAIAAAKTETEAQVDALAQTLYTKSEVEALISQAHTWGEF